MEIPHIQHIGLGSRNIGLRFARYAEYDMFYTDFFVCFIQEWFARYAEYDMFYTLN